MPDKKQAALIAIDPGLSTGVAVLKFPTGDVIEFDNVAKESMQEWLMDMSNTYDVKHVVMENFVLYKNKARQQVGSKMPAVEVIGMVQFWAKMHEFPVHLQMASILNVAEKQTRITKKGKSHATTHYIDAINHGKYFLYSRGLAKTPAAKEMNNE